MHTLGVDIVSNLLEEMPLALFRFEIEGGGRMHYLSSGIEKITGYQPIHFLFQPLSVFREGVLETDRLQLGKLIHEAQKDNGSYEMTYRFRHQYGSVRYLFEKGTCYTDEYGRTWIEGYVADMSQKKREDEQLQKKVQDLELLSLVAERTGNAVTITDTEGKFVWVNEAFRKLTGYDLYELEDKRFGYSLDGPEITDAVRERVQQAIRIKKPFHEEFLSYGKLGRKYWVEVDSQPLFNSVGEHVGFMTIENNITGRKLMESNLKENEERYRLIFDNALDGILLRDSNGFFYSANQAALHILGYSEEEIRTLKQDELVLADDRLQKFISVRNFHGSAKAELLFRRKNGSFFHADVSSSNFTTEKGEKNAVIFFRDISDKKEALKKLAENEERYRMIFENSMDGIVVRNEHDVILSANEAACKILGFTKDELLQIAGSTLVADKGEVFQQFYNEREENGNAVAELQFNCKDGSIIDVETSSAIFQSGKEGKLYVIVFKNITGQKIAKRKQQELIKRLSLATASADTGIWEVDPAKNEIFWDERMYEIFGFYNPVNSPLPIDIWKIALHKEDAPLLRDAITRLIEGKVDKDFIEYRIYLPDGTMRYVEAHAIVDLDKNGKVSRLIGTNRDVTDSVLDKQRLLMQNNTLREIAVAQSHEVRRPLANILAVIELIKSNDALKDPELLEHLDASANELDDLIKKIVTRINLAEKQ